LLGFGEKVERGQDRVGTVDVCLRELTGLLRPLLSGRQQEMNNRLGFASNGKRDAISRVGCGQIQRPIDHAADRRAVRPEGSRQALAKTRAQGGIKVGQRRATRRRRQSRRPDRSDLDGRHGLGVVGEDRSA